MCLISRFFNIHPHTPSSTVRMSFKMVARPIRCAGSKDIVHLDVQAMVVEIWRKICLVVTPGGQTVGKPQAMQVERTLNEENKVLSG